MLASAVAAGYAGRWARASAGGEGAWLVDGFAGAELQRAALRGDAADPVAVAMLRAAGEALGDSARVVLVEEDPGLLARVDDALRDAEPGGRVRRASRVSDAAPGEIVLVEAAFASVADEVADAVGGAPALVRLAPLAAKGLPWDALQPLAALPAADVLLRFPGEDFARQGRFAGPLADFPPHLRRVAEACSALLADPRHGWLLAWREAQRAAGPDAALAGAVERLRDQLAGVYGDVERLAHAVRLQADADAVHLLLVASDPGRASELEAAMAEAGAPPPPRAPRARQPRSTAPTPAPAAPPAPAETPPAPPPVEPAAEPPPLPEPVSELRPLPEPVSEPLPEPQPEPVPPAADASAALLDLFDSAEVDVPIAPAEPSGPAAPRSRKPRAPLSGLIGLFDEPEPAEDAPAVDAAPGPEPDPAPPPAKKPRRRKSAE